MEPNDELLQKTIKKLSEDIKKLTILSTEFAKAIKILEEENIKRNKHISNIEENCGKLEKKIEKLSEKIDDYSSKIDKNEQKFGVLCKEVISTKKEIENTKGSALEATEEMKEFLDRINQKYSTSITDKDIIIDVDDSKKFVARKKNDEV